MNHGCRIKPLTILDESGKRVPHHIVIYYNVETEVSYKDGNISDEDINKVIENKLGTSFDEIVASLIKNNLIADYYLEKGNLFINIKLPVEWFGFSGDKNTLRVLFSMHNKDFRNRPIKEFMKLHKSTAPKSFRLILYYNKIIKLLELKILRAFSFSIYFI